MGASGVGGGDKRNVNAELNLVPYIDLLSTLICFLLITAVWQQIDAVSANSPPPASANQNPTPTPATELNKLDLSVSIYQDHFEAAAGPNRSIVNFVNGTPDYPHLLQILQNWKQQWPDRNDIVLHSDSQAPYKHLIGVMDAVNEANFSDVGVNTN